MCVEGGGGGGVLSEEKGTNCGLTFSEMWLSQAEIAEQVGGGGDDCPVIIPSHTHRGAVIVLSVNILDHITIACLKISFNPFQKYTLVG